eukprot:CAMPEP_0172586296 /NCGR_PEP_ID=MMETSP1068-20121228/5665_1 /TAXON_ID=35684 /ORGANISM="Pseudopedinella elastica, Strain CCMP716" /LENGTH=115 /DNA_ID=CAMNT_0013381045 /DNA_START=659 /DNA_END=1002 /DNA_ORIENTATION=+
MRTSRGFEVRFSLRYLEVDEIKSEISTVKHVPEVHDADMNDRDGAARAEDAGHDVPKIGVLVSRGLRAWASRGSAEINDLQQSLSFRKPQLRHDHVYRLPSTVYRLPSPMHVVGA